MARTIYDKPTRALLKDMLAEWKLKADETFSAQRAVDWFAKNYPKLKAGSIHAHLVQASTNDPSRRHHPATNATDDLLFKVGSREYRRYQPGVDPAPIHQPGKTQIAGAGGAMVTVDEEDDDAGAAVDAALAGSTQFALERDLQRYLADNLQLIEPGLTLFQDEDITGFEYPAGGGRRIDILAKDKSGNFVVLELKVEKSYDRVVGQLLRYVNWVRKELAEPGQRVRRAAGAPSVEVDSTPSDSTLRETHRRRELVLGHQAVDRGPAESGHAHDRSHADEHGGLHIGCRRFRLGLRLAHHAAPGLRLRRTLGAADAPANDDFGPKSVG